MAIVNFDPNNELHQKALERFEQQVLSLHIYDQVPEAQINDELDDLDIIIQDIIINELECDEYTEPSGYIRCHISDASPQHFGIVVEYEYYESESEDVVYSNFIKFDGEILIKDNKEAFLNIDPTSLDFATSQEFNRAEKYKGK